MSGAPLASGPAGAGAGATEHWSVGFDVGGTLVKYGALSSSDVASATRSRPTDVSAGPAVLVALLVGLARELAEEQGSEPSSIGIGCAGWIDAEAGVVVASPNLPGWDGTRLRDLLERALGCRAVLINDANAFILAEARLGAARGAHSAFGFAIGTGVGGGFVHEGRLWLGARGFAGEPGHMPIALDGPRCACGGRGCAEAFIGARAIVARYHAATAETLPPREIALRARAGDAIALQVWRDTGRFVGLALAGITALLDPEVHVIGGGISDAADLFLPAARETMGERLVTPRDALPRIIPAELGPGAGWIGAALWAREHTASAGPRP